MRLASLKVVSSSMFTAVLALLASGACRNNSSNNVDAPAGGDAARVVKIQDVQNDMMPPGTMVALSGVVVTAIDTFGGKTGDIWVEEPEGGPFSGVHVYKAPLNVVSTLAVGDVVDLSGAVKAEFALTSDTTGRTVTELEPPMGGAMTLTKTGTGTVPAPAVVDALAIGQMSDADTQGPNFTAAWEQWEGVLITVNNISAESAPKAFGSTTPTPADNYSFGVTGVIKVEGSLADITSSGIARQTCLASATGVLDYFFDYLLLPRQTSELATGGTACPAPENTALLCGDSIDNDANGFSDCMDDGCMVGVSTCRATSTINALDVATTLPTGGVELGSTENVCVTAIASNNQNFWVGKQGSAAAQQGVYVYGGGQALPGGVVVGSKLDIIGKASAFKPTGATSPLLEVDSLQVTNNGTCNVNATTQTAATLTAGATFVGTLVTMTNVKIVTAANAANHNIAGLSQAGTAFEAEADIHILSGAANTCFASITGIWTWDPYNNVYALQPLAEGTGTGSCP